jgi:hypothetical protein
VGELGERDHLENPGVEDYMDPQGVGSWEIRWIDLAQEGT